MLFPATCSSRGFVAPNNRAQAEEEHKQAQSDNNDNYSRAFARDEQVEKLEIEHLKLLRQRHRLVIQVCCRCSKSHRGLDYDKRRQ